MWVCLYMRMCTYISLYTCVRVYANVCVCVYTYMQTHRHMYLFLFMFKYMFYAPASCAPGRVGVSAGKIICGRDEFLVPPLL